MYCRLKLGWITNGVLGMKSLPVIVPEIVDGAMIVDTGEISAASEPEVSEKIAPAGA